MQLSTVCRSFAEVARALGYDDLAAASEDHATDAASAEPERGQGATDLAGLLASLETAGATLATVLRRDDETRELAAGELAEHDRLAAVLAETEHALARA